MRRATNRMHRREWGRELKLLNQLLFDSLKKKKTKNKCSLSNPAYRKLKSGWWNRSFKVNAIWKKENKILKNVFFFLISKPT